MIGLFAIVPVSVLLGITFLVLVGVHKVEHGILRTFGATIAILLLISTFLAAACSVYTATTGMCPMKKMTGKCKFAK